MKTIYIGKEEVHGYAKDFARRLDELGDDFPTVWCPIGKSGDHLLRVIAEHVSSTRREAISVVEVFFDKATRQAQLKNSADEVPLASARNVLVIDSSVHSGGSMLESVRRVESCSTAQVLSYSLVIKRSSMFVPHYFGVMVGDHDRVLFLLDELPNNRLYAGKYTPLGLLRRIEAADAHRTNASLDTGVKSLDKISWGDLYYESRANGYDVFVIEDREQIAGFIKLKIKPGEALSIDVIANDQNYRGKGVGAALMRFAESLGRANECRFVELWAISDQLKFYGDRSFKSHGETIDTGDGETYTPMRKPLLYHFTLREDEHAPALHHTRSTT